jgi:16S rRNA (guanine966-N2)-methyltransferase
MNASKSGAPGSVRIISGQWRGSKLPVLAAAGLRPTSDRVRETLFNWLQQEVAGRRVLDLFAGSGALGFEAASRGAREVVLVERDPGLAASLREQAHRLRAGNVRVDCAEALAWLGQEASAFDLVFVDPPFDAGLHQPVLAALSPWLASGAWIYVESPRGLPLALPEDWEARRNGQTRDVDFALYRVQTG